MRGMILAAGRGERMGALTADLPKPLLRVANHFLIEYAIYNLKYAGICEIVINIAYHGAQIKAALGNGERHGVKLFYSEEPERLEVGGGIFNALPLLGSEPFLVVSGDIITDYPFARLLSQPTKLAHLVLVDNPDFLPQGDFGLQNGEVNLSAKPTFTFANIGVYNPTIFSACQPGYFNWRSVMMPVIERGEVTGEHYRGEWFNVGTPKELALISERLQLETTLLEYLPYE